MRGEQLPKIGAEVAPVASRIGQWMADCPELAETPAAQRLVDLAEGATDRGLLEVHRYFGFGYREDHESLRESFFEVARTVIREWDETVEDPPANEAGPRPVSGTLNEEPIRYPSDSADHRRVIQHVEKEPEYPLPNCCLLTQYYAPEE